MEPHTGLYIWIIFKMILLLLIAIGFFYVIRLLVKALKKYLNEDTKKKLKP
jgi:hypothetical protein